MIEETADSTALNTTDLVVGYGGPPVVRGVSMDVHSREFLAVLGASGSGKTTLLRAIAGYLRPEQGTITIDGRLVAGPSTWIPPEKRRVGIVPQEGALFPHLDVAGNIAFGLSGDKKSIRMRVSELLEMVDLAGTEAARPHELSGGQQQRVALARALAPQPQLLLLDEPFSALDATLRSEVRSDVRALLTEVGTTTILVTHDQEEALSLADRVAVMYQGRIEQLDRPWIVYEKPATLSIARFVGDLVELPIDDIQANAVSTALGSIRVEGLASGLDPATARVVLRPEQLVLVADRAVGSGDAMEIASGTPGRVQELRYHGHDSLTRIVLDDGTPVHVRSTGGAGVEIGDRVRVLVTGSGRLYADDDPRPVV